MDLTGWIDPKHLTTPAIAALARRFAADPHHAVVIDDFLAPRRLDGLRRLFSTEGIFAEQFYRLGDAANKQHTPIDREQFLALPPERRSSVEAMYVGPQPDYRLGVGLMTHLKLQHMLDSPPLHDLMLRVTGIDHGGLLFMPPRIFSQGHFVSPHSDAGMGKQLCAILYLSTGWRPGFGGEFRQASPSSAPLIVEPLANRLLLFRPVPEHRHEVLPLAEAGRDWQRWAYSFWFGSAAEPAGRSRNMA